MRRPRRVALLAIGFSLVAVLILVLRPWPAGPRFIAGRHSVPLDGVAGHRLELLLLHYDAQELFEPVNASEAGSGNRPRLVVASESRSGMWLSRMGVAMYDGRVDTVAISTEALRAALADDTDVRVGEIVVMFILFHELAHRELHAEDGGTFFYPGRYLSHPQELELEADEWAWKRVRPLIGEDIQLLGRFIRRLLRSSADPASSHIIIPRDHPSLLYRTGAILKLLRDEQLPEDLAFLPKAASTIEARLDEVFVLPPGRTVNAVAACPTGYAVLDDAGFLHRPESTKQRAQQAFGASTVRRYHMATSDSRTQFEACAGRQCELLCDRRGHVVALVEGNGAVFAVREFSNQVRKLASQVELVRPLVWSANETAICFVVSSTVDDLLGSVCMEAQGVMGSTSKVTWYGQLSDGLRPVVLQEAGIIATDGQYPHLSIVRLDQGGEEERLMLTPPCCASQCAERIGMAVVPDGEGGATLSQAHHVKKHQSDMSGIMDPSEDILGVEKLLSGARKETVVVHALVDQRWKHIVAVRNSPRVYALGIGRGRASTTIPLPNVPGVCGEAPVRTHAKARSSSETSLRKPTKQ